jgi:hypothetical protein
LALAQVVCGRTDGDHVDAVDEGVGGAEVRCYAMLTVFAGQDASKRTM